MIHRLSLLVRMVRARPRLFSAAALGISVTVAFGRLTHWGGRPACSPKLGHRRRRLPGARCLHDGLSSDIESIRRRAAEEDDGQFVIPRVDGCRGAGKPCRHLHRASALRGSAAAGSRALSSLRPSPSCCRGPSSTPCSALHYAHEFYDESDGRGLIFPGGEDEPDYGDFVYFAPVKISGLRRSHQQGDPPHGRCPRRGVLLLQRGVARAHCEHRSECHLKHLHSTREGPCLP